MAGQANKKVRLLLGELKVPHKEVALRLGMSASAFSEMLKYPIATNKKKKVIELIHQIAKDRDPMLQISGASDMARGINQMWAREAEKETDGSILQKIAERDEVSEGKGDLITFRRFDPLKPRTEPMFEEGEVAEREQLAFTQHTVQIVPGHNTEDWETIQELRRELAESKAMALRNWNLYLEASEDVKRLKNRSGILDKIISFVKGVEKEC